MAVEDVLRGLMEEVKEEGSVINKLITQVNDEYCKELDEAVVTIDLLLGDIESGEIDNYSDEQLVYYSMKLPALMYRAGCKMAQLGSLGDIARGKRKEKYNDIYLRVSGTRDEKKAKTEKAVENEQIVEDVYTRAYTQFNNKLDNAERLYSGIKKALSHKMKELDLNNGQDVSRYSGGSVSE